MAERAARRGKRLSRAGTVLILVGLVSVIGGAAYGFISIGSVGTGELDTVPLGTPVSFTPVGSYRANIFTGGEQAPQCTVTTTAGQDVNLGEARPYALNQEHQMQSTYGFDISQGTTYLIVCGSRGDAGDFAVVEVPIGPERIAFVLGSLGAVAFIIGLVLTVMGRRRWRPGTEPA